MPGCRPLRRIAAALLLAISASAAAADREPGLVAVYRSPANAGTSWVEIDARPAFYWGAAAPHPALGSGPFEVRWRGKIDIRDDESFLRWGARAGGSLVLSIDGQKVLQAEGHADGEMVFGDRTGPVSYGEHDFLLEYRSPAAEASPARIQLWWEGESFGLEPLPAWVLSHDPGGPDAETERLAACRAVEEGQHAALDRGCGGCHGLRIFPEKVPRPGPAIRRPGASPGLPWLLRWLDHPGALKPGARMPRLFREGREGFVERWLIAAYLRAGSREPAFPEREQPWRDGQWTFVRSGCAACHPPPDSEAAAGKDAAPADPGRFSLKHIAARLDPGGIADIILHPLERYPDGRMPRFPLSDSQAAEVAAYIWQWGDRFADAAAKQPDASEAERRPEREEILRLLDRRGIRLPESAGDGSPIALAEAAGEALARSKRCGACHDGLPEGDAAPWDGSAAPPADRGCLSGATLPAFHLEDREKAVLGGFLEALRRGWLPSEHHRARVSLQRAACRQCHSRDSLERPPLESVALRESPTQFYARIPYLRVPSLTGAGMRFRRSFLASAIASGVSGSRPEWYSYRMPAYGDLAPVLARAILEGDGEAAAPEDPAPPDAGDEPAEGAAALAAHGPFLAGYQGYSCISCHLWKGKSENQVEPGSVGPDLTLVSKRIRKDWFRRWMENPQRFLPGNPMPAFFPHGAAEAGADILGRSPEKQKEALWAYLLLGERAEAPPLRPPIVLPPPAPGRPPRAGQIPIQLRGQEPLEALAIQFPAPPPGPEALPQVGGDLLLYDVERLTLHAWMGNASLLRDDRRFRTWEASGDLLVSGFEESADLGDARIRPLPRTANRAGLDPPHRFLGFEILPDGARIRTSIGLEGGGRTVVTEELRIAGAGETRRLARRRTAEAPAGAGTVEKTASYDPPAERPRSPASRPSIIPLRADRPAPVLPIRSAVPGYGAVSFGQPDGPPIMPCSLAVHPGDGSVYIASMKMGEIFRLAAGPGDEVRYLPVAGPFQEPYGMAFAGGELHVLHRRNISRLSRLSDEGGELLFRSIERTATWPQGLAASYDWGYGLVPEAGGSFLFGMAPWADASLKGAGGVLRARADGKVEEVAYGLRNAVGWCAGPGGELFITDNQGEWVASNRLCHIAPGRFYGFPNSRQPEHRDKPKGPTAVWVPYSWARSLNGMAFDSSGGRFGPFDGQFFIAELMAGGAIIRAQVEKVNGEFQGACFPFWGEGLLGPLVLAFDGRGSLYSGGITEPGWMGQTDRGGLFRITYGGPPPFEIREIHALRRGFEMVFTRPAEVSSAAAASSYRIHHYHYAYGPDYGSPELDRAEAEIRSVRVQEGGLRVELEIAGLAAGRIYYFRAPGVRDPENAPLVHPEAAYTLNAIPER